MHSPMLRERRCDISGADRRMIRDITWQNNTEISRQKRKNSYPMGNYASDFIWNIASLADLGAEGHAEMMGTFSENAGKMLKVRSECVGLSAGRWDVTTKKVCVSDRREGPSVYAYPGRKSEFKNAYLRENVYLCRWSGKMRGMAVSHSGPVSSIRIRSVCH